MAAPKTTITQTTRLVIEPEEAERVLKEHYKAPAGATLKFECGYDYLDNVVIEWTETTEEAE